MTSQEMNKSRVLNLNVCNVFPFTHAD